MFLMNENLISSVINNKRKLSTSTISSSATSESSRPPSTNSISPVSFTATFQKSVVEEVEIPENLKSAETYEFIGFDRKTALKLWGYFLNAPEDAPDTDFLDYAQFQLDEAGVKDATSIEEDWVAVMDALGINQSLQKAILLPEFEDLRATASCKFWLMDTMRASYDTLVTLNERLRLELARRQRGKKDPVHRKSISGKSPIPSLASPTSRKSLTRHDLESLAAMSSQSSQDNTTPKIATSTEAPMAIDLHTMIWRASGMENAKALCNSGGQHLDLISTGSAPGDFDATARKVYFTPQRETANRYAKWLKHKLPISDIAIVQIAVPETLLRSLSVNYLWYGDREPSEEWKKVIWCCRGQREWLPEIQHLLQKDLWVGHIATSKHIKYEAMADHTKIKESDVLTIETEEGERRAIQWVFHTLKARREFAQQCFGKTWIHSLGNFSGKEED